MISRIYEEIVKNHFLDDDQMAFLSGPRQVGKTTIIKAAIKDYSNNRYVNFEKLKDRYIATSDYDEIIKDLPIEEDKQNRPAIALDEIHKYGKNWKRYLKAFIDEYKGAFHIAVTGSAKLNIYQRGGDSMLGRYFLYRINPLSVGELLRNKLIKNSKHLIHDPMKIDSDLWDNLYHFSGFPEPLVKQKDTFLNKWKNLHIQNIFREDVKDLISIRDINKIETLGCFIQHQTGQLLNYSSLSRKLQIDANTVKSWVEALNNVHYCFLIRPWGNNIPRTLIKEPKIYLYNWSLIEDKGAKFENFIAVHLLKSVQLWEDCGYGIFNLFYLRDKEKREVDFLVTKNNQPWIMVECKYSAKDSISKNLYYFRERLEVPHIFQVVFDNPYKDIDCFSLKDINIVPAKTFLSQLI